MIETAEFFSFHFIALSRPPPSWTGCSQSVRPLVVFDRSARLCKNSPEGALCMQLSVFIPSFDGFSSRRPLLVHHLLARGHCPPRLCLFRRTAVSRPEQLASRVSSRWRYLSYFPVKRFLLQICNSTPFSLKKYVILWSVNQSKGYSNIDLLIKNCLLLSTIIIFPCFL
jgi:hypothetical protein